MYLGYNRLINFSKNGMDGGAYGSKLEPTPV
jgi:hypothetical protein